MSTGEIVGIAVAVIVAFMAAAWQIKASRERPRPRFTIEGEPSGEDGRLPVVFSNAGGAAVSCHALAHVGKDFYEFRGPIAAQLQDQTGAMARLGDEAAPTESEAPFVVWVVAADGRDRWLGCPTRSADSQIHQQVVAQTQRSRGPRDTCGDSTYLGGSPINAPPRFSSARR